MCGKLPTALTEKSSLFTNSGNASTALPTEPPISLPQAQGNPQEGKRLLTAKVGVEDLVELCRLLDERPVAGIPNDNFPVTAARCASLPMTTSRRRLLRPRAAPRQRQSWPRPTPGRDRRRRRRAAGPCDPAGCGPSCALRSCRAWNSVSRWR